MRLIPFLALAVYLNTQLLAQNLIASYPLKGGGEDITLNYDAVKLIGSEFTNEGANTKGLYDKSYIQTPIISRLSFKSFTISVDFKADELKRMPVFALGRSCRLINFQLGKSGEINLVANNGKVEKATSATYQTGKWYNATMSYDGTTLRGYLGGDLIGEVNVTFSEQCVTTYLYGNQDISTTDFGNGDCFAGTWRNLKVYNGIWTPSQKLAPVEKEKISIKWLSPTNEEKTVVSHYKVKADIESKQPLVGIKLYNNNHLIKSVEITNNTTYKYAYNEMVTLHTGENKLVMHALTAGSDHREFTSVTHRVPQSGDAGEIVQSINTSDITTSNSFGGADRYFTSILAAAPDNGSYVAWQETEGGMVHVSRFNESGQLIKDTKVGAGKNAYAITADNNGFVLLLDEKGTANTSHDGVQWIFFVKYDINGNKLVENKLIGHPNFDAEHNMGSCPYWSTPRIVYSGKYYYAVFGVFKKWDDGVVHQGDYLTILDEKGNVVKPDHSKHGWQVTVNGWSWGTSHSFDQRIRIDEDYVHVLAKGDAYPRGIGYKRILHNLDKPNPKTVSKTIQKISDNADGRMYQYVPAALGDIMPTGDGAALVSYVSKEGRASFDLAINYIDVGGTTTEKWLTNTSTVDEHNVYMAEYGDNYLLAWTTQEKNSSTPATVEAKNMMAVIDVDGNFIVKPFEIETKLPLRSQFWADEWYQYRKSYGATGGVTHDFQVYKNGDIGWVFTDRQTGQMYLNRIKVKK